MYSCDEMWVLQLTSVNSEHEYQLKLMSGKRKKIVKHRRTSFCYQSFRGVLAVLSSKFGENS